MKGVISHVYAHKGKHGLPWRRMYEVQFDSESGDGYFDYKHGELFSEGEQCAAAYERYK